ncbi:hypothetical protein AQ794_04615 [Burkholderia pseudomallei]|nr:hypothetical protein AQ754_20650 [Burkholderia pseudomallei]OMT16678.1 hypothetical protein AQ753_05000 [Burkholderia pseudomallei]OMT26558.1 hypothetical protein AQ755_08910 [Burkholderia pseudomallei]OMV37022.1 hypothetical protein AQ791_10510 [Burkholderia pseudomallei]OMV41388.1 hypothetical protein AQ792_05935 [Burkholderia pseudomallei]
MFLWHDTEVTAGLAITLAGSLFFDMVLRRKRLGLPRVDGMSRLPDIDERLAFEKKCCAVMLGRHVSLR